jgi:hypothetical protein
LDGTISARAAVGEGGLGSSTSLQVLALLEIYGVLDWDEARGEGPSAT